MRRLSRWKAALSVASLIAPYLIDAAEAANAPFIPDPVPVAHGGTGNPGGNVDQLNISTADIHHALQLSGLESNTLYAASFGAVCNHSLTTLQNTTTFLGLNSTGWTLSQWQTLLPKATSLQNYADGLAWGAVFAAAKTANQAVRLDFHGSAGGQCDVNTSVDFTGSLVKNLFMDFRGVREWCYGLNNVCFDVVGSLFETIWEPYVTGDCSGPEPYSGIRGMRHAQGQQTGNVYVFRAHTDGCFSHAAVEWSEEVSVFIKPLINNQDANGTGRAFALDARNSFNANATEQNYAITVPVDSGNAITQFTMEGGNLVISTGEAPLYINGGEGTRFYQVYTNNNDQAVGHKFAATLRLTQTDPIVDAMLDLRSEFYNSNGAGGDTAGSTGEFLITSDQTNPHLYGLTYKPFADWSCGGSPIPAGCGVFVLDPAIQSITAVNLDVEVLGFRHLTSVPLFADPQKWSGSVKMIQLPFQSNMPFTGGVLSGPICIQDECKTVGPVESLTLGPDNVNDDPAENTLYGQTKVGFFGPIGNFWRQALNGVTGNDFSYQLPVSFGCDGGYYDLVANTINAQTSMAAGDSVAIYTAIRGVDLQAGKSDKGSAVPMMLHLCFKSSITGNVALDLSNALQNEHWVHNLGYVTANTYQEFFVQVPPWSNPSRFATGPNAIGLRIGLNLGCGANFQKDVNGNPLQDGVWTDTNIMPSACLSSSTPLATTSGATLSLSYLYASWGYYPAPNKPRKADVQTQLASAYYQKSTPKGQPPSATNWYQGAGMPGAVRFTLDATGSAHVRFNSPMAVSNLFASGTITPPTVRINSPANVSRNCFGLSGSATGSISGNVWTVTANVNTIQAGQTVVGAGVAPGTTVSPYGTSATNGSGSTAATTGSGGSGTYALSASAASPISSEPFVLGSDSSGAAVVSNVTDQGFDLTCPGFSPGQLAAIQYEAWAPM